MRSTSEDKTWPKELPSILDIAPIFDMYFEGEMESFDDPNTRLRYMQNGFMRQYVYVTERLHEQVTVRGEQNYLGLDGRRVETVKAFEPMPHDGLTTYHGINRRLDVKPFIVPEMQEMVDEVVDLPLRTHTKLGRIAAMAAVVTAEAQAFSDGNTRVARAVHEFIKKGAGSMSVRTIFNPAISFSPPEILEEQIMMRNLSHVLWGESGTQPTVDETPITADAITLYEESKDFLHSIYQLPERTNVIPFMTHDQLMAARREQRAGLRARIKQLTDPNLNERLLEKSYMALNQRKYGAAAWASAFRGDMPVLPLDETDVTRLEAADLELLRMRVTALARGVARGGEFVFDDVFEHHNPLYKPTTTEWQPWGVKKNDSLL